MTEREPLRADNSADFVNALTLHKERIRRLQEALCECPHRDFFQASLHDELCPVYVIGAEQAEARREAPVLKRRDFG